MWSFSIKGSLILHSLTSQSKLPGRILSSAACLRIWYSIGKSLSHLLIKSFFRYHSPDSTSGVFSYPPGNEYQMRMNMEYALNYLLLLIPIK